MKMITVVVPTYNEEKNIQNVYERVTAVFLKELNEYNYEIMFVDNLSQDNTRNLICNLAKKDFRVKAIFNAKNFGYTRSHYYALLQAQGDCAVLLHADLQNPPELIPDFVKEWEKGYKVVIGIKNASKENKFIYFLRTCYYKIMKAVSNVEQIEHFTDFELLDKDFLEVLKKIEDTNPYLRGIISEFGFAMKRMYYTQEKRKAGKSWAGFFDLYDFAMLGITSYSKAFMRMATFIGAGCGGISAIIGLSVIVQKLLNWDSYPMGMAAISVGVFFLGSVQLFFIGILGEYILSINTRVMRRPLVIEECRINFDEQREEIDEVPSR